MIYKVFSIGAVTTVLAIAGQTTLIGNNQYYHLDSLSLSNGKVMDIITINGPSTPPFMVKRPVVANIFSNNESSESSESSVESSSESSSAVGFLETPAFSWSFGCSATSGAMIAGYYDRHGYPYVYAGPTNEGKMPLDNSSWPDWTDDGGDTRHQTPLSATHDGLDGRVGRGHVDDYWIKVDNSDDDPFVTNGWDEHPYGDCTADFMKTNQTTNYDNSDGATTFYFYNNGDALTAKDMEDYNVSSKDGAYGLKLFFESRGYTVTTLYNQKIDAVEEGGFSFEQYKAEIDAGYPVMIHLQGHTIVGVGYDENETVYLHDTWDYDTHSMTWGDSYAGMEQEAVSIVHLAPNIVQNDFNKDGIPDILFRDEESGKNLIFFLYQTGVRESYAYTTSISSDWSAEGLGDFNADGITDILFRNQSNGKNLIFFQKEDGSRESYAYTTSISNEWKVAGVADFNGDKIADILFRNQNDGKNLIFFQKEDGSRESYAYTTKVSTDWTVGATVDFNNDGIADILYRNQNEGKMFISFQKEDGSRDSYTYLQNLNSNWIVAGVGDFNGDKVADILFRNQNDGKNLIFFQKEDGSRESYAYTTSISNEWKVAGVADFNGDKIADILFRNQNDGKNLIFFQKEDGSRESYKYTTKLSTKWKVIK